MRWENEVRRLNRGRQNEGGEWATRGIALADVHEARIGLALTALKRSPADVRRMVSSNASATHANS